MNRRKTKVMEVPHSWMRFLAGMAMLMFCLSLFCANAGAAPVPYDVNAVGTSDVYGIADGELNLPESGYYFGSVRATATTGDGAYAIYADNNDITITGTFGSSGLISAWAAQDDAFGLYSFWGTLTTDAIDGNIVATAGGDYARGLFSWYDLTTGAINGKIDVNAGGQGAAGLWAAGDYPGSTLTTGNINGVITAYAGDGWVRGLVGAGSIDVNGAINGTISATSREGDAIGLYSMWGSITTGAINGTIIADANTYYAYGLRANGDVNIVGGIGSSANISATTRIYSGAYGLYAGSGGSDLTIHGDIDGTITADANRYDAYALYAYDDIIIDGNINGTIRATAGYTWASGLESDNGSIYTGAIDGNIIATAGHSKAYGLRTWNGSITTGAIDGNIVATAEHQDAYGLRSGSDLTVNGGINGTITADANQDYAYGLRAAGDINIVGDIGSSANISATTRIGSNAYGLYADPDGGADLTIHGDIDGTITADANQYNAYALYADGDINIVGNIGSNGRLTSTTGEDYACVVHTWSGSIYTGAIDGNIIATAGGSYANGLFTGGGVIETGAINGNITATAENSWATGLCSWWGSSITTGDINGVITATAGSSLAAGLYAPSGSITTGTINGTIRATATEGDTSAYGLYGNYGITTGPINGTIAAEMTDGSEAYAMYSPNGDINVGDIGSTARLTGTAGGSFAHGLYSSSGSIYTGDINGRITTTAGDSFACDVTSWNGFINTGAINGALSATAGNSYAYGLSTWSSNGTITTGEINGTITAEATSGSDAYAMYTYYGDINIVGDIGSSARITATARQSNAYGLYSNYGSIYTGDIDGTISATAGYSNAYGLYSGEGDSIHTGVINGTITAEAIDGSNAYALYSYEDINVAGIGSNARISATARDDYAYGLYSNYGSIYTGDIDGTISAETPDGYEAYAVYAHSDLTTGDIGSKARITGTSRWGDDYGAFGLYSWSGSLTTGAIDGIITAEVTDGSDGYAMFSWLDLTTGNIGSNAQITATVDDERAYGLFSQNGSITTGDIDGTITATAWERAYGLYSDANLTTGTIRGTISAHADEDYAYGILSRGPMNVTIGSNTDGGNVSAVADDGTNVAAILSGAFNDSVTIKAGSTIVGDIDLTSTTDNDTLTLSGVNTRSTTLNDDILNVETINITGGTWNINGNVLDSLNGIALNGGILGGTGNLGDLNVGNGTLAPGGSIGTMTVSNLTLGPLSTFEAEVANDETADKVIVTGAADVNGTIRGKATELIDHAFAVTVIDAATGLTGRFSTKDTAFLNYSVTYDTTNYDVILNVEPTLPEGTDFSEGTHTGNQCSVGNALNDLVLSGEAGDVLEALYDLPDMAAVNNAYNQMMPQDALGQAEIIRNAMNRYGESLFSRMDNIRGGTQYAMSGDSRYLLASAGNAVALPSKTNKWTPFAKGFGSWGDREAGSDIAGYQYGVYGMTAGMDKLVSENTLIGISIGGSMANIDYSQSSTSSDIDSMFCSLYGSYFKDDWHLDLTTGYGHSWYESKRGIPFMGLQAESDHQGNAYSAAVELGKNFGANSMILEPVVGMGYILVQESGYTEKGAGALNLKVDSDTTDGIYSKLGIRAAKEFRSQENPDTVLVPNVSMFWIHDYADRVELSSSFVGGGSFTTEGQDPVHDTFNLGAGLNIYLKNNVRLFVDYGWQSASSFNSNTVQAGAQWSF